VFERFGEEAREAVVAAHEEARALGHAELGAADLVLGVARVQPGLLGRAVDELRPRLAARGADAGGASQLALAATAQVVLVTAAQQAPGLVAPSDLLLALVEVAPAALRELGLDPAAVREGAVAAGPSRPPATLPELLRSGHPVEVRLGEHLLGDLGHRRVDARLVHAILARDGRFAALLREHGIDEALLAPLVAEDG